MTEQSKMPNSHCLDTRPEVAAADCDLSAIEFLDDRVVRVLRRMTPVQRLELAFAAHRFARQRVVADVRAAQPEISDVDLSLRVAERLQQERGSRINWLRDRDHQGILTGWEHGVAIKESEAGNGRQSTPD